MPSKKVTRKKLKNLIKSSRTKKLPQNLKDISVKTIKNKSKHTLEGLTTDNLLLITLINFNIKFNNFELILNNKLQFLNTDDYHLSIMNKFNKLYFPFNEKKFINILKTLIDNYSSKKKRFIILPIDLIYNNYKFLIFGKKISGHQNTIIIDLKEKKAEFFEPYGGTFSKKFNKLKSNNKLYNSSLKVYNKMKIIFEILNLKIILPYTYLDLFDLQVIQNEEIKNKKIKFEHGGYCLIWNIFFINIKLKYPDADLKKLIKHLKKIILKECKYYTYFIRNYSNNLHKETNKILLYPNNKIKSKKERFNIDKKKLKKLVEKHFTIYK